MVNTLIVYYSLEGNCEFIANTIAQEIGCPIQRLIAKDSPDPNKFSKYFWGGKQVLMKVKPELEVLSKNPEEFDLIILGTPVWASTYSPAIRSFISQSRLSGKYIALFCCHEGGKGKTLEKLEQELRGNTVVGKIDFIAPLKENKKNPGHKEKCRTIAQAWADEVYSKVKLAKEDRFV